MRTARHIVPATTAAEYRALVAAAARADRSRVIDDATPVYAFVNQGRWIARCRHCPAGLSCDPDWSGAGCLECFHWYPNMVFPGARHEIESVLGVRRAINRNWVPGESLDELKRQNADHDLPPDESAAPREGVN